jgi:hypothetical protein
MALSDAVICGRRDWTAVRSSGNNAETISGHKMLTIFQAWR